MICVHDFLRGEVSVKVGVMEFELNGAQTLQARVFLVVQL